MALKGLLVACQIKLLTFLKPRFHRFSAQVDRIAILIFVLLVESSGRHSNGCHLEYGLFLLTFDAAYASSGTARASLRHHFEAFRLGQNVFNLRFRLNHNRVENVGSCLAGAGILAVFVGWNHGKAVCAGSTR